MFFVTQNFAQSVACEYNGVHIPDEKKMSREKEEEREMSRERKSIREK